MVPEADHGILGIMGKVDKEDIRKGEKTNMKTYK